MAADEGCHGGDGDGDDDVRQRDEIALAPRELAGSLHRRRRSEAPPHAGRPVCDRVG